MCWRAVPSILPSIPLVLFLAAACAPLHGVLGSDGEHAAAPQDDGPHVLGKERKYALTEQSPIPLRCALSKFKWCEDFLTQEPISWKTAPRGNKACQYNCSSLGVCNHDIGYCHCGAGWTGEGCRTRQPRPCTNVQRLAMDTRTEPISHIGPDKRDVNWEDMESVYSRCGGICDDDLALCYCDGPLGRINAPEGSPPGTPPIQVGRPLVTFHMAPKTTWNGKRAFGEVDYDNVYGPQGYCNVSKPVWGPNCGMDALAGPFCDEPIESFCPGACAGHGRCYLGFCYCDDGYYGHDCARRRQGMPLLPSRISTTPWLASVLHEPPAAMEPPPRATRRTPLIYVYDLEPLFQARILQYRISPPWCVFRRHDLPNNRTEWSDMWVYAAETLLHELLLISEHRTFDPEEADFFYVPHQASCLPFPINSWADWPWFKGPGGPRIRQMLNMIDETRDWVDNNFPFWKRRNGKDHIFLFTHDEGACWAPNSVNNSVWLTHWGRMDLNHTSNTAFYSDRYDLDIKTAGQPEGFRVHMDGHPCYNPVKDLVIPAFKRPDHYNRSPLSAAASRLRDIFFFFRGDVGKRRQPNYSRGVRQKLYKTATANGWREKHNFMIGDHEDLRGDYSDMLSRSVFCLVAAGDGWSARLEDAVLHGCIPVIIIDNVHVVFESILDVDSFAVRIAEADIPRTLDILQAIPERKIRAKQAHLGHVWHRYRYSSLPGLATGVRSLMERNEAAQVQAPEGAAEGQPAAGAVPGSAAEVVLFPRPFKGDPAVDDAFATILQWLHSRIPHTRG